MGYKFFSRPPTLHIGPMKQPAGALASGIVIVSIVFLAVLANAFFLVHASLANRYSLINIVESLSTSTETPAILAAIPGKLFISEMTPANDLSPNIDKSCLPSFNAIAASYDGSFADYLWVNDDKRYSLQSRAKLAEQYGIDPYDGTYAQNQVLWAKMLEKAGKIVPIGRLSCVNSTNMVVRSI